MTTLYDISVIIPIYNAEKYLEECLNSVLNSELVNIQVICVNDGSTDASLDILEKIKKHKNIEIINTKNLGASAARNTGLTKVKGEFILFMDADDTIPKDYLSELYKNAKETGSDVIMTGFNYIQDGQVLPFVHNKKGTYTSYIDKCKSLVNGAVWDLLFRSSCILNNKINFLEGRTWEDNLFVLQALYYSKKMNVINGPRYNYRQHISVTRNYTNNKKTEDARYIYEKAMEFANTMNMNGDEKSAVDEFLRKRALPGYIK